MPDDFYMNILEWCNNGKLLVALQNCIYTWCPISNQASKLFTAQNNESITCLKSNGDSSILSIGYLSGTIKLLDIAKGREIQQINCHKQRVAAVDWNQNFLASGSKDKSILVNDIRIKETTPTMFYEGHKQEVCGLRWSFVDNMIASGGNDNKFFIWETRMNKKIHCFNDHTAAVRAIAWSPHDKNIVMSGGGTNDKSIKIWNTNT